MKKEKNPENPLVYPSNLYEKELGITLRDEFAGKALQGMMSQERIDWSTPKEIAENCYNLASAMLEIREELAKEIENKQIGYSEKEVLSIITELKYYLSFGDEFNEIEWFEKIKKNKI